MIIVEPKVEPIFWPPRPIAYSLIESAGRTCYKSERREGDTSEKFIQRAMDRKHFSLLEHVNVTLRITCDRGISHELVRHRLASYSQESTRYCNYQSEKFGNTLCFIRPSYLNEGNYQYDVWVKSCKEAEQNYFELLGAGLTPEEARGVLPNSLKTEVVVTMNLRNWRHFLEMRYSGVTGRPHPQMFDIAEMVYQFLAREYPVIFGDLTPYSKMSRI